MYDLPLGKRTGVPSVLGVQNGPNTVLNTSKEDEYIDFIDKSSDSQEGVRSENGGAILSSPEPNELENEYEFKDSTPEPKPRKRKSIFEQLGIPKAEKRELTEEERRKVDELVANVSKFSTAIKSEDFWKGLDFGSAF
jgi:hypothetical protein